MDQYFYCWARAERYFDIDVLLGAAPILYFVCHAWGRHGGRMGGRVFMCHTVAQTPY